MKLRKIKQVEVNPHLTVAELLNRMKDGCGFTGKRLGQAEELLFDMYNDIANLEKLAKTSNDHDILVRIVGLKNQLHKTNHGEVHKNLNVNVNTDIQM